MHDNTTVPKCPDCEGEFNRRQFMGDLERELKRAQRFKRPLAVLIIDVDHFKSINDTYGHHAGDVCLKNLTGASVGILRQIDSFGRIGGEEFAALLPETDTDGAVILAERLRESLSRLDISVGDESIEITVSIGVANLDERPRTAEDLLRKADEALYAAKGDGRNRVSVATWED